MGDFIEGIFPMILLGYMGYAEGFFYCLIPMFSQIVYFFLLNGKHMGIYIILTLLLQGLMMSISELMLEEIHYIDRYMENFGVWNTILDESSMFNIAYASFFLVIVCWIQILFYIGFDKKLSIKDYGVVFGGNLVNLVTTVFMMHY